ncbi:MAG: YdjC family protein [Gemmatimonadetes bacterium]|nr:YdjC family protein [Gemmatimonadota bacterium]
MRLLCAALLPLALASSLPAQTKTIAERLGYPANAKLLILHADDLGVSHSVDAASFDALDKGAISSASIMMPTPWITEVATYAKAHPNADLGLHLTVTAEWETYRWGSVASKDAVASLHDADATFPRDVETVVRRAKPAEVERELRAQVDRALAVGIRPTHLDSHMGALFATPDLMAAYVKVANDYKLPYLAPNAMLNTIIVANPNIKPADWLSFYVDVVSKLTPGVSEIIVHLGNDDAELQAVMVGHDAYGSAWRQRDRDVVHSAEFKKALKDNNVTLVRWKDLQTLVQ